MWAQSVRSSLVHGSFSDCTYGCQHGPAFLQALTRRRRRGPSLVSGLELSAAGHFAWDVPWQGLKSVCESSVLEGHGFSRAVNSLRASGLYRLRKKSQTAWEQPPGLKPRILLPNI